jgi:hypothetical protein
VRDLLEVDRSVKIDDALQNGKPWMAVDHMRSVGEYDAFFDATAQIARYTPFISPAVGGIEIWGDTLHTAQQGASLEDIREQAYASTVAVMAGEVIETGAFMAGSAGAGAFLAIPALALATPVVVVGAIAGGLVAGVLAGAYYADENYIHDKGESYSSRFKEWFKDSEPTFKPVQPNPNVRVGMSSSLMSTL